MVDGIWLDVTVSTRPAGDWLCLVEHYPRKLKTPVTWLSVLKFFTTFFTKRDLRFLETELLLEKKLAPKGNILELC